MKDEKTESSNVTDKVITQTNNEKDKTKEKRSDDTHNKPDKREEKNELKRKDATATGVETDRTEQETKDKSGAIEIEDPVCITLEFYRLVLNRDAVAVVYHTSVIHSLEAILWRVWKFSCSD